MELLEPAAVQQKMKPVNIKKEISRYLRKWPWFVLSMLLFYLAARIWLRYAEPQYFTKTTLKLQETKANNNSALSDLKNLGMGVSGDTELQGETTVVLSKPILEKVVKNLNLDVSFYSVGTIKEVPLYKDSPLTGSILSISQPAGFVSAAYVVKPVGNNSYKLNDGNTVYRFGLPVKLSFGTVRLDAKPGFQGFAPIKVVFRNVKNVVGSLESSVNVTIPENKGLLMELSLTGPLPAKSEDILNELARQYIQDGIDDKNLEAQNTQNFINDRLAIISEDLSGIESQKEGFKRSNQITDLEAQASQALASSQENTKTILTSSMQLDLINSVYGATSGDQLLPSGVGLPAGADKAIGEYNDLLLTRNRTLKQATNANPAVIEMNKELASLKNLIRKNLLESRETLQLQLAQANAQLNVAKGNISRYPTQEKVFRSIDRQQNLKEQLYLYLLQKREENAITLAVTAPKAKVINPAYTTGVVKPNAAQVVYGALAAGFLLPLLFFVGLNVLDTKVHTKEHILAVVPEVPVIAETPVNTQQDAVVHPGDFSVFTESFRILGSNLKFMLKAKESAGGSVILVTSSVKGEGKTTVSMNIALTLGGSNRVLIIGADIRNPQLNRFVGGKNTGLTDFLVSDDELPDNFILKSGISENVDVMFSGQIAPNPNDLLDMPKFDTMINYLRSQYDYIVLDSAPVMLVSDTLTLLESADVLLYIVKAGFTEKEMLDFAGSFRQEHGIRNMAFVLNGLKPENSRYKSKYGYGENYPKKKKGFFIR